MKFALLSKSVYFIALSCFLAPTGLLAETKPEPKTVLEYQNPIDLMKDFTDVSKKSDKSLRYWLNQLILLWKENGTYKPFLLKLRTSVDEHERKRTPQTMKAIIGVFLNHQNQFSNDLRNFIFDNLGKVKNAITTRAQKHSSSTVV